MGCGVPLMALAWSTRERTVEKAAVRWTRVLESSVPVWPMGIVMKSTLPQCFLRAAMSG